MAWQVRRAQAKDLPGIAALLSPVGGDQERLQAEQFVVAEDDEGSIIGCGRLKPYPGVIELASLAIAEGWRGQGVGGGIVTCLLEGHQGPVHLMCEDNRLAFFSQFGFKVLPESQVPEGLRTKWQHYVAAVDHLNLMRRE